MNENLWLLGSPRRSPTSRLATIDAAPRGCYGRRSVGITDEVAVSGERVSGRRLAVAALAIVFAIAAAAPSFAGAAKTRRVSVSSTGAEADDGSYRPAISPDGRFIAFISNATNLVSGDTNGFADVFVRDLKTHRTRRVSVSSAGAQANGASYNPSISADGRFVAFYSGATNLVGNDTNGVSDVFVRDLKTHKTRRVSLSSAGVEGNSDSYEPSISADGRFVVFHSFASNLVGGDTNATADAFVRDLKTHKTRRVSVSSSGLEGDGDSVAPEITADGRFVAFYSYATDLVGGDTNGFSDIFVRDQETHKTKRVSVSSAGAQGNDNVGGFPSISADGRFLAFASYASNLVPGDTNTFEDVFLRNRKTRRTTRVSASSSGAQANGSSFLIDPPVISADGRFVAFISNATNLVGGTTSGEQDFLRDRKAHRTKFLDVSSSGVRGNNSSWDPALTPDGRFVAFPSSSSNLVAGDTNGSPDIFIRGPLRRRHRHRQRH